MRDIAGQTSSGDTAHHAALNLVALAAEQVPADADLRAAELRVLHRAGESEAVEPAAFVALVGNLSRNRPLARADRAAFDRVMDYLFGHGFRDPELPEVSQDYRDFLDAARLALGLDDVAFRALLAETAGGADLARITGEGFVCALHTLYGHAGRRIPTLPARGFVDRSVIGQLHAAVHALGLTHGQHTNVLIGDGGGCLRTRDLDRSGAQRVLSRYIAAGYVEEGRAPRVAGDPGFITQPQANLIWKLWRGYGGARSLAELDAHCGGSLASLTTAGVRRVIDELLAPMVALRLDALAALAEIQVDARA